MNGMFSYCDNLKYLDLSNFNTKKVNFMFIGCVDLAEVDLSSLFDTKYVIRMAHMFNSCKN